MSDSCEGAEGEGETRSRVGGMDCDEGFRSTTVS